MAKRLTKDCFIERGNSKYGVGTYDYSAVNYVNAKTKVDIICKAHGVYSQTPNSHLSMGGCKKCGTERAVALLSSTGESFKQSALLKHEAGLYAYAKVDYKNAATDVCITCLRCNTDFMMPPNRHLCGSGCPACCTTGYSKGKPGHLYVLQSDDIAKIGITNRSPVSRAKSISKSSGMKFTVVSDWLIYDGAKTKSSEKALIALFRARYCQPIDKFDGSTECFIVDDIELFKLAVQEEVFNGYSSN